MRKTNWSKHIWYVVGESALVALFLFFGMFFRNRFDWVKSFYEMFHSILNGIGLLQFFESIMQEHKHDVIRAFSCILLMYFICAVPIVALARTMRIFIILRQNEIMKNIRKIMKKIIAGSKNSWAWLRFQLGI